MLQIPKEYDSENFKPYIHQYCWISNLYKVPFTEQLPVEVDERMEEPRSLDFYRWVFLIFLIQALMFKFPNVIWRTFNTFSGINIKKIVVESLKTQLEDGTARDANITNLALWVERWLRANRKFDSGRFSNFRSIFTKVCFCFGKRNGCFLTRLYICVKALYLINILAQFHINSTFLHFNYWNYGTEVARMLTAEDPWEDLVRFPRVGMCDLEIRQLQNIQRHTVQCALPINMFLEKAYAVIWFGMVILAILTSISLLKWTVEELFTTRREKFLNRYLERFKNSELVDEKLFKRFVRDYLKDDGVFLMRILTNNTGEILTFDILNVLWARYKKHQHKTDEEYDPESKPLTNGPGE